VFGFLFLSALLSLAGLSISDASGKVGTCSLHITHGMIKYLGSTKGAVMRDSAVEMSQTMVNEVVGSEDLLNESEIENCSDLKPILPPSLPLLMVALGRRRL